MTFIDAVGICFHKYLNTKGTAKRSEYWWFTLFIMVGSLALSFVGPYPVIIFSLLTFLPSLSVSVRRLHDTDRSGWWLLLSLIPYVGTLILLILFAQDSKPNRYTIQAAS